jgi:molybdate transport system substrate-binding protein
MNRRSRLLAATLAVALAVVAGCAFSAAASAATLTVSAAASLQDAMRAIGSAFEAAHPGTKVDFNFAASGLLLAQIAHGAPVDVFASADLETMDRAQAQHLVAPATRADFASNALVLVSPRSRPATFKALADLGRADVRRIALGTPASVPAGHYAQAALEQAGLWATLAPKFVFAENVRQTLAYVSRAEVDAGFVYRTDAIVDPGTVRIDFAVPGAAAVRYPIARVAASHQGSDADAFIAFVTGAPGRAALARYGFGRP